nr:RNA-directed DNA polymerase, eukaryota [Tanacetum cinerariifolium]
MDSNESDDDHDMEEHRSTNEDVDPNAALDDFIQQNIVKENALKDSKEGDQANVSTHVVGDNETLFSEKVKEEYFVTKEDKPSEEDVSDTSKPPGFENFIKENSECSISSNASRSGKCSTSFDNYKRKELKCFPFIDEMSRMIEVGGTLGYDVKGKLKTHWSGPFTITKLFPYGTVELSQANGPNFKVNGHRVKHYFGGDVPQLDYPDCEVSRALSFCKELHVLSFILGIQYPNLID